VLCEDKPTIKIFQALTVAIIMNDSIFFKKKRTKERIIKGILTYIS
jgi:hypothetical protein